MREKLFSVGLDDCRVDTFTVGGHGGAGKDTSNTGVRITHEPSGAVGCSTETRSQRKNKVTAFRRMAETKQFETWVRRKAAEMDGQSIDEQVDEAMDPKNLQFEARDADGKWTKVSPDVLEREQCWLAEQ
jgi:protein subunit release factor A